MTMLIGYADKVIFKAEEYTVANIRISAKESAVAIYNGELPIRKSIEITMIGEWVKHPAHGRQFKVERFFKAKRRKVKQ